MDAGKMAAFVEENFSNCWKVVALRNAQYYQSTDSRTTERVWRDAACL